MDIFANILRILDAKGMSMADLSRVSGVPRSTISQWHTNLVSPSIAKLQIIAKALEVPLESLLADPSGQNDSPPPDSTDDRESKVLRRKIMAALADLSDAQLQVALAQIQALRKL